MNNSKRTIKNIFEHISETRIKDVAYQTGFAKRKWKKISPVHFFTHLCIESSKGIVSYKDLALTMELNEKSDASRQAYHGRMNKNCLDFFKAILAEIIKKKTKVDSTFANLEYKRILVQDSTIINLPARLYDEFSGSRTPKSQVCQARIQSIYDLLTGNFVHFSIDYYSKTDVSSALDFKPEQGDLILRDRGYSSIAAFIDIISNEADFIARYKHKTNFYDIETGEKIDLLKLLKKEPYLDRWMYYGVKKN